MAAEQAADMEQTYFTFLLTDGSSPGGKDLMEMIEACKTPELIVSTIGVGQDVDRTMMYALANAGRGYCQFLDYENNQESIKQKVR